MSHEDQTQKNTTTESFGEMIKAFGEAISEIFNDPELKEQAKKFSKSATKSAEAFTNRFQDEDVKSKFRDVGKAAQEFGNRLADHFKDSRDNIDK